MGDSAFIKKVDEIELVHNTMEYVSGTYGNIKDQNPLLKQGLEKSEDVASWMKGQAEKIVTAVKLDEPLKQIDSAAANGIDRVGKTSSELKDRIITKKDEVQELVWNGKEYVISKKVQVETAAANTSQGIFSTIQNALNFADKKLEPVMVEPYSNSQVKATPKDETAEDTANPGEGQQGAESEQKAPSRDEESEEQPESAALEDAEVSTEPNLSNTASRVVDMSYRLNLGLLNYGLAKASDVKDVAVKNFSPQSVRTRASIVRQEITGTEQDYLIREELTGLDRTLIGLTRPIVSTAVATVETVRAAPNTVVESVKSAVGYSFDYTKGVYSHLTEATSVRQFTGIAMEETRTALLGVTGTGSPLIQRIPFFGLTLDSLISGNMEWLAERMVEQEKRLQMD